MTDDIEIVDGPFNPDRLQRWAEQVRAEYPGWEKREDNRVPALLAHITEKMSRRVLGTRIIISVGTRIIISV
jgi:hypothetical protein